MQIVSLTIASKIKITKLSYYYTFYFIYLDFF